MSLLSLQCGQDDRKGELQFLTPVMIEQSLQDLGLCSPIGTSCSLNLTTIDTNCSVSCDGFYGDIFHKENDPGKNKKMLRDLNSNYNRYKEQLALNMEFDFSGSGTFCKFHTMTDSNVILSILSPD